MSARLSVLALSLAALPLGAQAPRLAPPALAQIRTREATRAQQSGEYLKGRMSTLGLDGYHAFDLQRTRTDEFGLTHTYFTQTYRGVPVWGGVVLTHLGPEAEAPTLTDAALRRIRIHPTPSLEAAEALAIVHGDLNPTGPYAHPPKAERVVYPKVGSRLKAGLPSNSATWRASCPSRPTT